MTEQTAESREVVIRDGTAQDFEAFYGRKVPHTMTLKVADMGGEIIALAGFFRGRDTIFVFSDITEKMKAFPVLMMKEAYNLMGMVMATRVPAVCVASNKHPRSKKLLEHLGWEYMGETEEGSAYRWLTR